MSCPQEVTVMEMKAEALHLGRDGEWRPRSPWEVPLRRRASQSGFFPS